MRRWAARGLVLVAIVLAAKLSFDAATHMEPPRGPGGPAPRLVRAQGVSRMGRSYLTRRGGVWELGLAGSAWQMGLAQGRLARPLLLRGDAHMIRMLRHYLPNGLFRSALVAVVRLQHRGADQAIAPARRLEIAGEARGLGHDPYAWFLPAYERMIRYHSAYDVALSFEGSPVLGCSAFAAAGPATADGHTIVGRNFDAELGETFDRDKTVTLYRPSEGIPFASVAWPGLTGVVTGMNLAGVWVSVNGARAGDPRTDGTPLVLILRDVLEHARTVDEAIRVARRHTPMVSHMVLVADGDERDIAVIERSPDRFAVRRGRDLLALTNHFETALRDDPEDAAVRRKTSTLARRTRLDELLAAARGHLDVAAAIGILRDRRGAGGGPLPLGDRRALDALIATHSVVADATARVLWVAEAPHTLGRYVRFDLRELLDPAYPGPRRGPVAETLPADPLLAEHTP
jgi:hypothetical protein